MYNSITYFITHSVSDMVFHGPPLSFQLLGGDGLLDAVVWIRHHARKPDIVGVITLQR